MIWIMVSIQSYDAAVGLFALAVLYHLDRIVDGLRDRVERVEVDIPAQDVGGSLAYCLARYHSPRK